MVFSHQVSAVSFYLEQFLSLSVFYNTDIFEEFDLFFKKIECFYSFGGRIVKPCVP